MTKLKYILYGVLALLCAIMWSKWQTTHAPKLTPQKTPIQHAHTLPSQVSTPNKVATSHHRDRQNSNKISPITITTDVLKLTIDPQGGNIIGAQLRQYDASFKNKNPLTLMTDQSNSYYVTNSGFDSKSLPQALTFTSEKSHYNLNGGQSLTVILTAKSNGITVIKRYTLTRNHYAISVSNEVINHSGKPITGRVYHELIRIPPGSHKSLLHSYATFTGIALSTTGDSYQKVKFDDISDDPVNIHSKGGWAAMLQHYFISAWVPPTHQLNQYYTYASGSDYGVGIGYPEQTIASNKALTSSAKLYIGPAIASRLQHVAPHLSQTIDYGWLWFISDFIFLIMHWIYQYIGNWGWAIVFTTMLIKLVFFPLSAKSYRSMAKMRALAPRLKLLKEKCAGDKQKLSKATMELYRQEKVNPLGGCLPMIIQIPVFIGLYWVLLENVEFRQAPFIFWIHDLSAHDPYYIMPVLMGLSMFLQQRLNPAPTDPTQAKVMMFLPVVFTVLFLSFPAGLVLYWVVNNCMSMAQQSWVMYRFNQSQKKRG